MRSLLLFLSAIVYLAACQSPAPSESTEPAKATVGNPPADGFNADASDEQAIALADEVMAAMGGRTAWDTTRYFSWNFLGFRNLLWDKEAGDVRIEVPGDSSIYLVNVKDDTGQIILKGREVTQPDSLAKYVQQGKEIWINDSYWLFMPFKLKDSGVTLTYGGEDTLMDGSAAEMVTLQFENVGVTPQNRYDVYVDPADKLVKQWAYFPEAATDTPAFMLPWDDYQAYGSLQLAGNRGKRDISSIEVMDKVDASLFERTDALLLGE